MPVAAINREVSIQAGTETRLAITPGVSGSVDFRCADANGTGTVTGRRIYMAQTLDIPAGSTVYLRAIGTDATYEDASAETPLSAPPSTFSFSTPANEAVIRIAAYRLHIANLAAANSQPPPARVAPYMASGSTYYIDPTNNGAGRDGSLAKPFNAFSELSTLSSDTNVLLKAGSTLTTSAFYECAADAASATAAVVFGVYDPATGRRIVNPPPGSATVVCAAASNNFFARLNNSGAITDLYVAFDGLAITGANASGGQGAIHIGGSAGMVQITNCVIASAGQPCVSSTGRSMFIQGCSMTTGGGAPAVLVRGDTGGDTASVISDNHFHDCGGIFHDAQGNYKYNSTIAFNTFLDCVLFGSQYGIFLLNGGGTAQIYGNNLVRCGIDMEAYSSATGFVDIRGMLIEGNTAGDCVFPLQIAKAYGYGTLVVQFNTFLRAGSQDNGATQADLSHGYGRCVEFYGGDPSGVTTSAAFRTGGGVFRYNVCANAFGFVTDGSEAVGIGLDNYACDLRVYGNLVTACEGQGIQCNRNGTGVSIYGNLVYDNNACTRAGFTFGQYQSGEIAVIFSPYTQVYNNTCVSVGRLNQKHSIFVKGTDTEFNEGVVVKNNLLIGASVAAIVIDTRGGTITESNNLAYATPQLRTTHTGVVAAAGSGTAFATANDFDLSSPLVTPKIAGLCDGTGGRALPGSGSGAGLALSQRTPVGWLHASF